MPSTRRCAKTSAAVALVVVVVVACGGKRESRSEDAAAPAAAPTGVTLRFMLPDGLSWREITDADRVAHFAEMADNEPARIAQALYAEAWRIAPPEGVDGPTLFIGIQPGGNFARTGFALIGADGQTTPMPDMPFLILDDRPERFRITLLHETGHVIHSLLVDDRHTDDNPGVAPIPHSTAAVTDRRTAFNEGWSIHLEAVNAHCGADPDTRGRYDRLRFQHGEVERWHRAEYYAAAADLRSYSQNFARYWMVRDGLFSFEPATRGDYLRVQLDPARDRRALRSGSAMVASEGFVASVFFHVVARDGCPPVDELAAHYRPVFEALRAAETETSPLDAAPIADVAAALGEPGVRAFLDLSRGATMDPEAGELWARFYDAALRVDRKTERTIVDEIETRRRSWERDAAADPAALLRNVGPVIVVETPNYEVGLPAFGKPHPMSFDLNAAGAPILRLIPGITEDQVQAILATRRKRPFADFPDFTARTPLPGDRLVPLTP